MRHGMDHRKLRRNPAHRKALLRNLMNALVRSERVETTLAKAKELRPLADRLITLGKRNTLHARRRAFSILSDKGSTEKLFSALAGRFLERAGGYTRIVRTGYRAGDGSEMALIEYLPREEKKTETKKRARRKAAPKKPPAEGKKPAAKKAPSGKSRSPKSGTTGAEKPGARPRGKKRSSPKETE